MNKRFFVLLSVIAHNMHLTASLSNNPYDDAYVQYKEQFEEINHKYIQQQALWKQLGFTRLTLKDKTSIKAVQSPTGTIFIITENQWQPFITAGQYAPLETKEFRIMQYYNGAQYKICANGDAFIQTRYSDDWIFVPEDLREFIN